jgi:hypothetical protein
MCDAFYFALDQIIFFVVQSQNSTKTLGVIKDSKPEVIKGWTILKQ